MKATEFITLEMKQRLDAKCWKGKHKEGTKIKGGVRVNNCVPNEGVAEGKENRCMQCGMTNCSCAPGKCKCKPIAGWIPNKGFKEAIDEAEKKGLYYNVNKRKAAGTSRDASSPKAPTAQAWKDAAKTAKKESVAMTDDIFPDTIKEAATVTNWLKIQITQAPDGTYTITHTKPSMADLGTPEEDKIPAPHTGIPDLATAQKEVDMWNSREQTVMSIPSSIKVHEGLDELSRVLELSGLNLTADEQFDIIEEMVEQLAQEHGVDAETIWEDFESVDDDELLESAAWRRSEGKSKKGGLNAKGVASYRRENPGSKLQTAVTTKPSKLKAGSKAAKRRKSFCARMGGVKGPMKKPNGKPTRKALALRKWNC